MANPELLILDEPCNGLDLFAREELLSRIGEMAHKESPTLIYVTHHTEEILPIFDHIMMLKMVKSTLLASASKFLTKKTLSAFYGKPVFSMKSLPIVWQFYQKATH